MPNASKNWGYNDIVPLYSKRKLSSILHLKYNYLVDVAERINKQYAPFQIEKKGKIRDIDNPLDELKSIQSKVHKNLLASYNFPANIVGGIKGKSIKSNARTHINKPVVVTIDVRDCFPNTSDFAVFNIFKKYFNCSDDIAALLTRLTTFRRHLPQGAPSSTILLNFIILDVMKDVEKVCKDLNLDVSVYVDDITISGEESVEIIDLIIKKLQKRGYAVRSKKVKVMRSNKPQIVTGLVVNKKISLPKEKLSLYRKKLYETESQKVVEGIRGYAKFINKNQLKKLTVEGKTN